MTDEVKQLPDEQEKEPLPIQRKSLLSRWASERWSVLREMWREQVRMVDFYMSPQGGKLSMEDAQKIASGEYVFSGNRSDDGKDTLVPSTDTLEEKVDRELSQTLSWDVDNLSWYGMDRLFRADPDLAEQVWDEVKEAAARDFESGHFAAELFERTGWQKNVWKRAHFVAVFQMMVEAYDPRDAIELQMVEVAAVEYFLWRHWTQEHLQRAMSEPRRESYDYQEWREKEKETWCRRSGQKRPIQGQWIAGAWEMPYQREADAVEQAAELAERFRRGYHAAIRALRDWRRYPVIVQNAGQVNIAADGGQQVNVQKQGKRQAKREPPATSSNRRKRATRPKPNQIGVKSPQESIKISPALESLPVE
jgi:hypothetical protein